VDFSIEAVTSETAVVQIGPTLDFKNASDFKSATRNQVGTGVRNFILDFSDTDVLDSTGLGSIFSLYRQLSRWSGKILFASVSPAVEVVVLLTRTYKVFPTFPSVDSAREAVHASS